VDYTADFVGIWGLVAMDSDEKAVSADAITVMESIGLPFILILNDDATFSLNRGSDELLTGTWEAKSATQVNLTTDSGVIEVPLVDSQLTFKQDMTTMVFEKGAGTIEFETNVTTFPGTWQMTGIEVDGMTAADAFALYQALSLIYVLQLNDDGTAVMSALGQQLQGTWQATSDTAISIAFEDGTQQDSTLTNDTLSMETQGSTVTFSKVKVPSSVKPLK